MDTTNDGPAELMAGSWLPDALPESADHSIPLAAAVTGDSTFVAEDTSVSVFPHGTTTMERALPSDYLGFQLFSPHYQPVCGAIRATREQGLSFVQDQLQLAAPLDPHGLADCVVALQPQRFSEYASFIRYPSSWNVPLHRTVAVILDLSHVGGHYFAAALPGQLSMDELVAFAAPHCNEVFDNLQVFLGFCTVPCGRTEDLALTPGVVITVLRADVRPMPGYDVSDLFHPGAAWGRTAHLPMPSASPGTCVMTDRHRFFLHGRRPYAHNLETEIAERLRCQGAAITIHLHDGLYRLDFHGDPCSDCALVLELPRPDSGDAFLSARRDVCTLLDFRPLGQRPRFWHSHFPALHIPSVLAHLGIRLPEGLRLVVHGGCKEDDDVYVKTCDVLVFEARASSGATADSASSDSGGDSSGPDSGPAADPAYRGCHQYSCPLQS